MSPVFVLTATSSPHGGAWHEYIVFGSQKRPPSGVTLRQVGVRRRVFVGRWSGEPDAARRRRRSASAAPAGLRRASMCPHCPAFITLVIISPSGLLTVTPFQLPPPTAPGKSDDVLLVVPGRVGHRVRELVFLPEALAVGVVLGRDLRELVLPHRVARERRGLDRERLRRRRSSRRATSLCGTGRSSMPQTGSPLVRSSTNSKPILVICATAGIVLPSFTTSTSVGAAPRS